MSGPMVEQTASPSMRGRRFRIEPVAEPSLAWRVAVPVLSVLLALVAGGVIMLLAGENPIDVYRAMYTGAFGSRYAFSETLVKTIPLLLTGLGVGVAFRMQLWNIGAEGQLYLGAIFATWVALFALPEARAAVLIPAMVVAGLVGGALWAAGPAVLRAWLGVNEIITTLMLNYVAILFAEWLVHDPWKNPIGFGFPGTASFPTAAWLPLWGTTRVHLGLAFGLIAAALLFVVLRRTRWGYEIAVTGESERVARYAGMATKRNILAVMLVSGALAGLAGMSEVAGISHQLSRNLSPGYGYTAIIVAWLGRLHPLGIALVALLLASLLVGGDQLQLALALPAAIAPMLQGTILFFLLGGELLTRYRVVRR